MACDKCREEMGLGPEIGLEGPYEAADPRELELYPELFPEMELETGRRMGRPMLRPGERPALPGRVSGRPVPPVSQPGQRRRSGVRPLAFIRVGTRRGPIRGVLPVQSADAIFDACTEVHIFDGFETGDYRLRPHHYDPLVALARTLAASPTAFAMVIAGHTDNVGLAPSNEGLSFARAFEVLAYLANLGLPIGSAIQAQVRAFGAGDPIAPNTTPAGRRRNRRVEIWICPVAGPSPNVIA